MSISARKLKLMRFAATRATSKYTAGGRIKTQGFKPVTLAKRSMIQRTSIEPTPFRQSANPYLGGKETAIVIALVASVKPKVVAEFGVSLGITSKALLDSILSIETYIGIDVPFGFRTRLSCQQSEVPSAAGLYARGDERFKLLQLEHGSFSLKIEDLEPIDAAFIDGDHSEVGVVADSVLARGLLRPGGIIVWHDYGNPAVEVTAALDHLAEQEWPIYSVKDTWLAYMRI
jgi:predicted O-methyltransferase YrrM